MTGHVKKLVALSVVLPVLLIIVIGILGLSLDMFDYSYYYQHSIKVINGAVPYLSMPFDYPPLALVPMVLATLPAIFLKNTTWFIIAFMAMMIVFNAGITVCVYYIGKKLYSDDEKAYRAGLISVTSIACTYFVVTKFDAFPVFLMMAAIAYTLYGRETVGHTLSVIGGLVKVFPGIAFPFIAMYRGERLWIWVSALIGSAIAAVLILLQPVFVFSVLGGLLRTGSVYVNTPGYLIYEVVGRLIALDVVSIAMLAILALIIVYLLYLAWDNVNQTHGAFMAYIALALIALVLFMPYRSPQYLFWYSPLLVLLVADDFIGLLTYSSYQIVSFFVFPVAFGWLWTNDHILSTMAYPMFAIEYALVLLMANCVVTKHLRRET